MARLVRFHGPGHPLELTHLDDPTPQPGEILVRITCCTLCGSDLHTYAGRRPSPLPVVLGHEIVGRIADFGDNATTVDARGVPLAPGDRITWTIAASCASCFFCDNGLSQKCQQLFKYGHEPASAHPFAGGLSDYVRLRPGTTCVSLPDDVPDTVACPANCATATVAGLLRDGVAGRTVLILGAGMLGLTACAMAREAGANAIVVSDPDPTSRARALQFGATHACTSERGEQSALVADATAGRGADVVLELAGVRESVEAGLALLRIGGTLLLAGTVLPTPAVALDPERVVRRMLTIRGVHNYGPTDLMRAVEFLAGPGRRYPFASLVTGSFGLEQANEAFEYARMHRGARVAVIP